MIMNNKARLKKLLLVSMFAALTAVGAFIRIPFGVSSFTLQFFITVVAGIVLGPVYGALSQLVYILLGLFGLPLFTSGGGIGYLFNPTCGFLLALPISAYVIGKLCPPGSSVVRSILSGLAGLVVLYLVGLPYMGVILDLYMGKGMGIVEICSVGMLPFLPFDLVKIVVASLFASRLAVALK